MVEKWQPITLDELGKHNDLENEDAWICVKGVVYDVAAYASQHPGGAEKIQKYAGKDATDVFNTIHPYVDASAILHSHQVGILKGHAQAPKRSILTIIKQKLCCTGGRLKSPTSYFKQDSIVGTYVVEFSGNSEESDWTVGVIEKRILQVFKCINHRKAWFSVYELPEELFNDQLAIEFTHNSQHIHIIIRKPIPASIWANQYHGLKDNGRFVGLLESHAKYDAFIIFKRCLTINVLMFGIQITSSARIGVPMGFHVRIHHNGVSRPYTPVVLGLLEDETDIHPTNTHHGSTKNNETVLYFIIKIYPEPYGLLTRKLDAIPIDDGREIPTLQISTPQGYFNTDFVKDFSVLLLIAGGAGITPMIKIIHQFSTVHNRMGGKQVALIFFCQKEYDIIWKHQFEQLEEWATWFHYFPVLTKPNENWQGIRGQVSDEVLKACLSRFRRSKKGVMKACICGPPGFNSSTVEALKGVVIMENIFVFSG